MRESNRLGKLGEIRLETWAIEQNIVPQRVRFDETGWDYILEFEQEAATGPSGAPLPADRWPPSLSCLVQVKATGAHEQSFTVRLRNLLLLSTSPLPAFILMLRFSNSSPEKAFLVHIDGMAIERVLRRAREAHRDSKDINEIELSFSGSEAHRIEANGAALKQALRSHIGPSMATYQAMKQTWLRELGYEKGSGRLTFDIDAASLEGLDPEEYLFDLAIGLKDRLGISNAAVHEVRFEIPTSEPDFTLLTGYLSIDCKPNAVAQVTISCQDVSATSSMQVYYPVDIARFVPAEKTKVRLVGDFFEIVLKPKGLEWKHRLPDGERKERLRALRGWSRMARVHLEAAKTGLPWRLLVKVNDETINDLSISPGPMPDAPLVALSAVVDDAWEVAKYFELQDDVEITLSDLVTSRQMLGRFVYFLTPGSHPEPISVSLSAKSLIDVAGKETKGLLVLEMTLGTYAIALLVSLDGVLTYVRQSEGIGIFRYDFTGSMRRIERSMVGNGKTSSLDEAVRSTLEAIKGEAVWIVIRGPVLASG